MSPFLRVVAVGLRARPVVPDVLSVQHAWSASMPQGHIPAPVAAARTVFLSLLTVPSIIWVTKPFWLPSPYSYLTALLSSGAPGTAEVLFSRPSPSLSAHVWTQCGMEGKQPPLLGPPEYAMVSSTRPWKTSTGTSSLPGEHGSMGTVSGSHASPKSEM